METNASVQERPDVPVDERMSHALIMRIVKLRWMGMENEAERIQVALRRADPACGLLAVPVETD